MSNKFRETYILSKSDIEYRDRIVDELKHRTHQSNADIAVYKENQLLHPHTISDGQIIIEVRVGNIITKVIVTKDMEGHMDRALFFGMRDAVNRMMDELVRRGAQSL